MTLESQNNQFPESNQYSQGILKQTVVSAIQTPAWSVKQQPVIIIGDSSSSMSEQDKANLATKAIQELVDELAEPSNKDAFSCCIIHFNSSPEVVQDFIKAKELKSKVPKISPSGLTDLKAALETALNLLGNKNDQNSAKPIVVLFSDGLSQSNPVKVAKKLKNECDIVTVAFGSDADEKSLKKVATSPDHFYVCPSGKELRKLFIDIGQSMSKSLSSGANMTDSLRNL